MVPDSVSRPQLPGAAIAQQQQKQTDYGAKPKRSLDYIIKSGLAGGLAGCAAKTVVAPLDRVKILFQTSTPEYTRYRGSWHGFLSAISVIRQKEGTRGLFKGHSATLLQKFPYAAINFLGYEQIRATLIPSKDKETPFRRLLSGSLAGVVSVLFTYPFDLIRVRMAIEISHQHRSSMRAVCWQIYHEHSHPHPPSAAATTPATATGTNETLFNKLSQRFKLANFYRGFSPTLLGMIPYAGMSFFTHDQVGDWLRSPTLAPYTTIPNSVTKPGSRHAGRPQLVAPAELSAGALAGAVAQTTSYPFEVLRRRMQVGGHRLGIGGTCRKMWAENGFRGFWVGLSIGYFKVVPLVATSFLVYERLKWAFGI
ncbi:hypothetical protein N7474_002898 [Penicillium riverlandense]|uniref:uncharacterized protein n=1 Tax=Penicillium riverlandense TaxID=1903569 RepID=UPI002548ADAC|nr:uncharacterized protein N7474_002898 [Penicillium riverlandense]KAJ5825760.1 hypothetical protein N7474_002898 [Penicillium riverlandense]